ncbi:hypothetical protein C5Z26_03195 [Lactobacillus sp. CBA3606]|uniref:hypothetical protein n=1 Tax=Lactobacillus sp. CBA3606 TaxID=2099789 RepID=UPI000CFD83D9|nr:hypothetical protein [Lactobacillus sp. CBA3606]AVK63190.1 hypothetical protein C5Z26_03195 [Lactobacillus sp. CBA3606]
MRLIDFKLSTVDLDHQLPLYWEHDHQQFPIDTVTLVASHLILQSHPQAKPLTLDQLTARTRQVNGQVQLMVRPAADLMPLFGYRLSQHHLLLG